MPGSKAPNAGRRWASERWASASSAPTANASASSAPPAGFFAKFLSGVMAIGYIMAMVSPREQALHDLIAGTYVIKAKNPHSAVFL